MSNLPKQLRPPANIRLRLCAAIAVLTCFAWFSLGLSPADLVPRAASKDIFVEFFSRAVSPSLHFEGDGSSAVAGGPLQTALQAAGTTIVFAAAGTGLALMLGCLLAILCSSVWWREAHTDSAFSHLQWLFRFVALGLRSVHELLWAVLFLSAFGLTRTSAVLAIALPYAGVFAKVFSELLDESPRKAFEALEGSGASRAQSFLFGIVPAAFPDILSYTLYRFECAVRTSAILGFFGFPTLGYFISASFENLQYGEVWTYLYVLAGLVIVIDGWSGLIRRRLI